MRHTANILVGQDLKSYAARLGKYILKYGEANASPYFTSITWTTEEGRTEIKKAVRDASIGTNFVSTMRDVYNTKLESVKTITTKDKMQDVRLFFKELHQSTVTINNPGDSNSLLLALYVPLYDKEACDEAMMIINATSSIQSHYTIMVVGLCESLGNIVSPEEFRNISAEDENKKKATQKEMLQQLANLKLEQNTLEQIVVLQNTNSSGFALNLDQDSFLRIMGELALICVEKYNTLFTQAGSFDREHAVSTLGLSVMNLDKYYFENYLLRRAYLRIMEREDVTANEVDLNKVAIIANDCLKKHKNLFLNFYSKEITPLLKKDVPQESIIGQAAKPLDKEFANVFKDLTAYIQDPQYSLPEKQAILAMILGYDDALLKGNLFTDSQLTLDNLDEDVAECFINANNECVKKEKDPETNDNIIIYGPLGNLCADDDGRVELPIEKLQKLRNDMRQSTNYIREKNKELEELEVMTQNAVESEKRLTKDGFIVDGNLFHFDIVHEEVKFDETYEPKEVTESSIDLRENFTKVKSQGQIGACTVFSVASIYEYILKKNTQKEEDLSESFVYYNVRHSEGKELEDTGSSFQDVIKSMGEQGICLESLHPYSHKLSDVPSEEAYIDGKKRIITKALNVNITEKDIKSAIQEGYPVAISLKIFSSFNFTSGFVGRPTDEEIESADYGHHAMVIVGYTDDTKYFVVRNSWGEDFGDNGYCYIPYSYICDPEMNRFACIIKDINYSGGVEIAVSGGDTGKRKTVYFNMSDAVIKSYVIRNLLEEEQANLREMQKEDANLRTDYEVLMQTLGKQSVRTKILESYMEVLGEKKASIEKQRDIINNVEREAALRNFDSMSWKNRLYMMGSLALMLIVWFVITYISTSYEKLTDWLQNEWCWLLIGISGLNLLILVMYWWYVKSQRRRMEIEFEEKTAHLSQLIHELGNQIREQKIKMHVAGMVIDELLTLKSSLDKKYQGMKSYIGNLSLWYREEKEQYEKMEPLVKDPFIPLLSNQRLNIYFDQNKDEITKGMHLYKFFDNFNLDEEAIVKYKSELKQNILKHIKNLLNDFTIFRHIFATKDYPFLDKQYASASNLLPILDSKCVPFCQIRTSAVTTQQGSFLFIHTDAEEEQAWKATYPQYFSLTPISDNISSVLKIIGIRLQSLTIDEVVMD